MNNRVAGFRGHISGRAAAVAGHSLGAAFEAGSWRGPHPQPTQIRPLDIGLFDEVVLNPLSLLSRIKETRHGTAQYRSERSQACNRQRPA